MSRNKNGRTERRWEKKFARSKTYRNMHGKIPSCSLMSHVPLLFLFTYICDRCLAWCCASSPGLESGRTPTWHTYYVCFVLSNKTMRARIHTHKLRRYLCSGKSISIMHTSSTAPSYDCCFSVHRRKKKILSKYIFVLIKLLFLSLAVSFFVSVPLYLSLSMCSYAPGTQTTTRTNEVLLFPIWGTVRLRSRMFSFDIL